MSSSRIFDEKAERYDSWYKRNRPIYLSELEAVRMLRCGRAVEIGIGAGRFARGTGLIAGVDPSITMLKLAPRSIHRVQGVGEHLPFRSGAFACSMLIITLCFVDDPLRVLEEASRVSEKLILCIVPKWSPWGKLYSRLGREGHSFYSHARFYSVGEVIELASKTGFKPRRVVSTLSYPPGEKRFEKPRKVSLEEAEGYGFTCIEFVKE